MAQIDRTHRKGIWLAAATALISGFAVFLNGYGVRAWSDVADPTTYTTVKNLVAALVIGGVATILVFRNSPARPRLPEGRRAGFTLTAIALIGGSVPFVLFFEGLARASSAQAAVIHKTLIIWVAALAIIFLRERIGWPQVAAIGLLLWGQIALVGNAGALEFGTGEAMVLGATLLWSVEVIVAKRVLTRTPASTVALARMGGGSVILVAWALIRGGGLDWSALTGSHVIWAVVAGAFLSGYVLTWLAALSLAPAVDVTAVLVGGALITALLQTAVDGAPLPDATGLALLGIGVAVAVVAGRRRREPVPS
ncbi:MAG: DMT family transporter [Acidimicrobiia bacterium]|jgi:drug/metabolite transporter (DMT)-like permease